MVLETFVPKVVVELILAVVAAVVLIPVAVNVFNNLTSEMVQA